MNRPCKHCGEEIAEDGRKHAHGLGSCQTDEKPYGYNAEPIGQPCSPPCRGVNWPDADERKPVSEIHIDKSIPYYLAGPMTGLPEYNYPAFSEACAVLRGAKIEVLSPHECPWPEGCNSVADAQAKLGIEKLWEYMMAATREMLERSHGVILLPGWYTSRGALAELGIVREAKLPTWYLDTATWQMIPMWKTQ